MSFFCSTFASAFSSEEARRVISCSEMKLLALPTLKAIATVAQLVEQRIRNAWVGGSSPPSGSKITSQEVFFCARSSSPARLKEKVWAFSFRLPFLPICPI